MHVEAAACVVGRLGEGGPWLGFAPSLDDGYELVIGDEGRAWRAPATSDDLVALAIIYFEDLFPEPPEELAATLGDIGGIVRHAAERVADPVRRRAYDEAVDAIDDGLAADVVIDRLGRALGTGVDGLAHLGRRVPRVIENA